jgi:hypothetical protein
VAGRIDADADTPAVTGHDDDPNAAVNDDLVAFATSENEHRVSDQ